MRERERVAAGDDDVADLRVGAHVVDHPAVVTGNCVPAAALHRGALARAKPAIHRANVCGDDERPVRIAVREAGDGGILVFVERVVLAVCAGGAGHFESGGDGLATDRVVRVEGVDQGEVIGGNCELVERLKRFESGAASAASTGRSSATCRGWRTAFCDCHRQSFQRWSGTSAQAWWRRDRVSVKLGGSSLSPNSVVFGIVTPEAGALEESPIVVQTLASKGLWGRTNIRRPNGLWDSKRTFEPGKRNRLVDSPDFLKGWGSPISPTLRSACHSVHREKKRQNRAGLRGRFFFGRRTWTAGFLDIMTSDRRIIG